MEKTKAKMTSKKTISTKAKKAVVKKPTGVKKVVEKKPVKPKVSKVSPVSKPRLYPEPVTKKPLSKQKLNLNTKIPTIKLKSDKTADFETVTFLNGTISLRLKEKAETYRQWVFDSYPAYARKVAVTFAYVFLVFGTLASSFYLTPSEVQHRLTAQVTCSFDGCFTSPISSSSLQMLLPSVNFLNTPTYHDGKPVEFLVSALHVNELYGKLISEETGQQLNLPIHNRQPDGKTTFITSPDQLKPGTYKFKVVVLALDNRTRSEFYGPTFHVPYLNNSSTRESTEPTVIAEIRATETTTTNVSDSTSLGTSVINTSSTTRVVTETKPITPTTENDVVRKVEESPVFPEKNVEVGFNDPATSTRMVDAPKTTTEPIVVRFEPGVYDTQYKIFINTTFVFNKVELYIRAENSSQNQFLGMATHAREGWYYWLDTISLPAGRYEIIVRGLEGQQIKHTKVVKFVNKAKIVDYKATPTYQVEREIAKTQIDKLATTTAGTDIPPITSPIKAIPNFLATSSTSTEKREASDQVVKERAELLLRENRDQFNEKLSRYASAVQSGDKNLARIAEDALNEDVYKLLADKVLNSDLEDSIYGLENELKESLAQVKEKVAKVESFKRDRTNEASSLDTDRDGISDYDEYLIYGTDPLSADTDNDGIIDGIEIATGYDPLDSKPEAIINFNSPKDISYIDDTVLSVKAVAPLLVYDEEVVTPIVLSEISGFGLPNSFVTLFIYSTPVIVTVKTKDDGSYSYTFTKELEDGEHEVYAALTDNKGQIVVRSNPFTFIKTAEAFTRTSAETETPLVNSTVDSATDNTRVYNIIAAMGVISFGIILLLLGQTLRKEVIKKREQLV